MRKALVLLGIVALIAAFPVVRKLRGLSAQGVDAIEARRSHIETSVSASGRIVAHVQVELRPEVIGRVEEVKVRPGTRVESGELVLTVAGDLYRADVRQEMARVRIAKSALRRQATQARHLAKTLRRQRALFEQGLATAEALESCEKERAVAEASVREARAAVAQAGALLEKAESASRRTKVYAPIAGVVLSVPVKEGETVMPGSEMVPGSRLMTIADVSSLKAEVEVEEADIADVEVGQSARVFALAYEDRAVPGEVVEVAPFAEVAEGRRSQSFKVKIRLEPRADVGVRPGMSCRVEIVLRERRDALVVPIQSVLYEQGPERSSASIGAPFVYVIQDQRVRKVLVELGMSNDSQQEILSGLAEGSALVTGPYRVLHSLRESQPVVTN